MSYTIEPRMLKYEDQKGLHKISIYVYCSGQQVYPPTKVKVKESQWSKEKFAVVNHAQKEKMNALIKADKNLYEGRLLAAFKHKSHFTKEELLRVLTEREIRPVLTFSSFADNYIEEMKTRLAVGRIKHYYVVLRKVRIYDPAANLEEINGQWLQLFENFLRKSGIQPNTINSNMAIIKKIVRAAKARKLIAEADFEGYSRVKELSKEPEFLNEAELQAFFNVARAINQPGHKLAAYYFLLSCLTGLRISDAKRFNYQTHVQHDEIIVRATKNKKIVTIPLYSELSEVLEFIADKPLCLSEEKTRQFVKEIASLAGIKKHVKYHSSRHTAASRFLNRGLSLTEVAEIIGDTEAVTKIYSHIDKQQLSEKIKKVMG